MAIQGLRDTSHPTGGIRPENWREGILMLEPNGAAPLYALTALMSNESSDDPRYHWFEEELPDYRVELGANVTASGTTLTVVEGATVLKEGDILLVEESGEHVIVTADPSTDTSLTVARAFAGTSGTIVTYNGNGVNPNLLLMGSAYEEGSARPPGRSFLPVERDNYCQIFRDVLEITNTAKQTRYRTGDAVKNDKRRTFQRHSIAIERALMLGRKSLTTHNGRPRRTMDGLIPQIPADRQFTPAGGGLTLKELENWLKEVFRFGANEKLAFVGNDFMLGLNQAVRLNSSYNIEMGVKEAGMNVSRFMTPFGTLVAKTHPLFNQITGGQTGTGSYTSMSSWGVILDAGNLKYRFLSGRDTKYETNLQEDGVDGVAAGYITECSIQVGHPKTHAIVKGVTAGAVDA